MVDLGPRARVAFAAAWLAVQAGLVVTAGARADGIFGFRMFPEASTMRVRLERVTAAGVVDTHGGEWSARDAEGQLRHFAWHDRVCDPVIGVVDEEVFAAYGIDTQLARLQRALDDVADHLDEDAETQALRAEVTFRRNGHPNETRTLVSHARLGPR